MKNLLIILGCLALIGGLIAFEIWYWRWAWTWSTHTLLYVFALGYSVNRFFDSLSDRWKK